MAVQHWPGVGVKCPERWYHAVLPNMPAHAGHGCAALGAVVSIELGARVLQGNHCSVKCSEPAMVTSAVRRNQSSVLLLQWRSDWLVAFLLRLGRA